VGPAQRRNGRDEWASEHASALSSVKPPTSCQALRPETPAIPHTFPFGAADGYTGLRPITRLNTNRYRPEAVKSQVTEWFAQEINIWPH
jgi:hypothetical protein